MTIYRRGSVTVEAIKVADIFPGSGDDELPEWVQIAIVGEQIEVLENSVNVRTTEGMRHAGPKDWIIQRQTEHGELYPITAKAFEKYTRVE